MTESGLAEICRWIKLAGSKHVRRSILRSPKAKSIRTMRANHRQTETKPNLNPTPNRPIDLLSLVS
jgi:hypothetical protein